MCEQTRKHETHEILSRVADFVLKMGDYFFDRIRYSLDRVIDFYAKNCSKLGILI